jgi:hypothetical protein
MRTVYAAALCKDSAATVDDLREAVTTLEDTGRTARRVLGGAHPITTAIELHLEVSRAKLDLEVSRAALRAREETPSGGA